MASAPNSARSHRTQPPWRPWPNEHSTTSQDYAGERDLQRIHAAASPAGVPSKRDEGTLAEVCGGVGVARAWLPERGLVRRAQSEYERRASTVAELTDRRFVAQQRYVARQGQLERYERKLQKRLELKARDAVSVVRASEAQAHGRSQRELVQAEEAARDERAQAERRRGLARQRMHELLEGSKPMPSGGSEGAPAAEQRPATAPAVRRRDDDAERVWRRAVGARCAHVGRARPRSAALVPTPGTFDQQLLERGAGPSGFVSRRDSRTRFHDRRTSFVLGEYAS